MDCPTQQTLIFMILHLYLSVFHDKYQSYKYEKHSREICYDCDGDDHDDDDKYDGFQPGDPPPSDKIATSSTHGSSSS